MTRFRRWTAIPLVAVIAGLVVGCLSSPFGRSLPQPVTAAFDHPDEVVLYSLDPGGKGQKSDPDPTRESFHGHIVMGKTVVADPDTRKTLFAAFRRGVNDHDGSVAMCFNPHHGLRVKSGTRTVDLVICFQCSQVHVFDDGKPGESFLISTSPCETFNDILEAAKVPLSSGARW